MYVHFTQCKRSPLSFFIIIEITFCCFYHYNHHIVVMDKLYIYPFNIIHFFTSLVQSVCVWNKVLIWANRNHFCFCFLFHIRYCIWPLYRRPINKKYIIFWYFLMMIMNNNHQKEKITENQKPKNQKKLWYKSSICCCCT